MVQTGYPIPPFQFAEIAAPRPGRPTLFGRLGVQIQRLTPEIAKSLGRKEPRKARWPQA